MLSTSSTKRGNPAAHRWRGRRTLLRGQHDAPGGGGFDENGSCTGTSPWRAATSSWRSATSPGDRLHLERSGTRALPWTDRTEPGSLLRGRRPAHPLQCGLYPTSKAAPDTPPGGAAAMLDRLISRFRSPSSLPSPYRSRHGAAVKNGLRLSLLAAATLLLPATARAD